MKDREKDYLLVKPPINYPSDIGRALWMLEDTRRRTKLALEGTTEQVLDWSFSGQHNTIGTILYHIAAVEMSWLYEEILQAEFPQEIERLFPLDLRNDQGQLSILRGSSLAEHFQRLDTTRKFTLAAFQQMSLDEYRRIRSFDKYDVSPEWVIHHLMQHEAEHRGQMSEIRTLTEIQE
jgi:uncharacterized damage-inducible protein DinB